MIAVVCFPPSIRAIQAPSQPNHQTTEKEKTEKKSDENKKADEEGAEKKLPAKPGENKNHAAPKALFRNIVMKSLTSRSRVN